MSLLWWEGGAPTLSTEKDCILTEYLAWHAGATFVYNYGLWWGGEVTATHCCQIAEYSAKKLKYSGRKKKFLARNWSGTLGEIAKTY
jgi:hypothetical protein